MKTTLKLLSSCAAILALSACVSSPSEKPVIVASTTIDVVQQKTVNSTLKAKDERSVELTLEQIMSDPDWLGRQPQNPNWSIDGRIVYQRKQLGYPFLDTYKTQIGGQNGEKVALSQSHLYEFEERIVDEDSEFIVWTYKGNVFAFNKESQQTNQLTRTNEPATNLSFMDVESASFQMGNAFYSIDLNTGKQSQLLTWSFESAPEAVKAPRDYIEQEQIKLIQYVQLQRQNRAKAQQRKEALETSNSSILSAKIYFDEDQQNVLASLSPNGKYALIALRDDTPTRDESDIMPDYIEENGRIKAQPVRQRVADAKPISHTLWFIDIENSTKKKLSYVGLPGYNEDVLAEVKSENAAARGETYTPNRLPRDIGLLFDWYSTEKPIKWHDDGNAVALMLEAWDNKDRWIVTLKTDEPRLVTQHRMHDPAWVNYRFNQFGWFDNQQTLYFLSEESGYSNLYVKPLDGAVAPIVSGSFVVDDPHLTVDDEFIYYTANKKHPGIHEIYRVNTETLNVEPLTDLNGMTDFKLSLDETALVLIHSKLTMPPELYTLDLNSEQAAQRLTETVSEAFLSLNWIAPSIVPIKSSYADKPIYSRVYQPENNNSEPRRAVVFNHGAGYLQNAHLGWSGYFREYMFHNFLVANGYVVLDMDFRASAGYGRDWRTAIYRQMGTPEMQDLRDGVNWLVANANVDRDRIGTYGGSYGGFLTFMALFKEQDLFQAGAALRPVSDWAHYNLPYTMNILNHPDVDPIAYERSSPIYFAEGLQKPLLINAPMVDNNVFFVDVVRLVQRLIELEKEDFETAIYPVEPHGFVQPSSWLDEYRRIFKLFEENL